MVPEVCESDQSIPQQAGWTRTAPEGLRERALCAMHEALFASPDGADVDLGWPAGSCLTFPGKYADLGRISGEYLAHGF